MIKEYLEIGKITGTHGIKGEMRVQPWCDAPDFMKKFKTLYLDKKGEKPLKVSCRPNGHMVIMKAQGIDTIEEASKYREKVLYMKRSEAKLPDGTYFIQELIDCKVIDADDESIIYGTLTDVSETGANDVWHITNEKGEYLIPAIPPVVIDTDVVAGVIKIRPLKGIFDDEN
ncbi:MAG: ribosome maturation factor RimM [Acutalibacteraceae bacterium]|nr:ribosome maturation factor RimM [Acutalibacteraceae bacterium]